MNLTKCRPRTSADFPGLERAIRDCHAKTGYPLEGLKDARAFICDDQGPLQQAWVAEHNGEIVGHIAINAALPDCPCVSTWRQRYPHDPRRIATVGRLFVSPGRAKGVLRALVTAVRTWSWQTDTHLIMYVVIWSPARALMANVLTGREDWQEYGRSTYHSPDGWVKDAVCYAAPVEWTTTPPPVLAVQQRPSTEACWQMATRMSALWSGWQALSQLSFAYYQFGVRQIALNFRSSGLPSISISLPSIGVSSLFATRVAQLMPRGMVESMDGVH